MSYVVLARKWRPQKFDEIVGQEHIVTTLKNAVESGRIAGAYLFSGSKGVGKTSSARIFAKSLNCVNGPTVTPCQKCSSCVEISESRSMDVIEIDGASNTGVDNIRELRENAKFAPINGKYKIYIIDEVHMLSDSAFNALLKILEEPPEHVKFIFATTHPHKLPPTIISRCQRFDFNRISTLRIIEQLEMIVASEKISVDKDALAAIARASDGSMRDAESILDQLLSFSQGRVNADDIGSVLGCVSDDWLFSVADAVSAKDPNKALDLLSAIISEGKDISHLLSNLIGHFRNLMVAKVSSGNQSLIDLPSDTCQRLLSQSKDFSLEDILTAFNLLVSTQETAKKIDSMRIPIEVALVKLAYSRKKDIPPSSSEKAAEIRPAAASAKKSAEVKPQPAKQTVRIEPKKLPDVPKDSSSTDAFAQAFLEDDVPADSSAVPEFSVQSAVSTAVKADDDLDTEAEEIVPLDAEYKLPPSLRVEAVSSAAPESVSGEQLGSDKVDEIWDKLIQHIEPIKISVASYLRESRPSEVKGQVITAMFPEHLSFHKEVLEKKENKRIIEDGLKVLLSGDVRIEFTLGKFEDDEQDTPEKREAETYIQTTLDAFGGKLV